jgi:hypothetical protein
MPDNNGNNDNILIASLLYNDDMILVIYVPTTLRLIRDNYTLFRLLQFINCTSSFCVSDIARFGIDFEWVSDIPFMYYPHYRHSRAPPFYVLFNRPFTRVHLLVSTYSRGFDTDRFCLCLTHAEHRNY